MELEFKALLAIVATILTVIGYIPYFRDIFLRKTQPHIYTWLIWAITQGIAVIGMWYGGGSWGAVALTTTLILVVAVFLLSFRYGTKNITTLDTILCVSALGAVFVWWKLEQPLLAVIMATAIDMIGYIPTMRKSFVEPRSETVSTWFIFVAANIISISALAEFNALTLTYIVSISIGNLIIAGICILRRRYT
jgi:hypothetical protein